MDNFFQGVLGGVIPAVVVFLFYLINISGRLARIETNIAWLIKYIQECPPRLKDHTL